MQELTINLLQILIWKESAMTMLNLEVKVVTVLSLTSQPGELCLTSAKQCQPFWSRGDQICFSCWNCFLAVCVPCTLKRDLTVILLDCYWVTLIVVLWLCHGVDCFSMTLSRHDITIMRHHGVAFIVIMWPCLLCDMVMWPWSLWCDIVMVWLCHGINLDCDVVTLIVLQAPHTALEQLALLAIDCDKCYGRHQLTLHEAVCPLQVTAVQATEDRVEKSRLPWPI